VKMNNLLGYGCSCGMLIRTPTAMAQDMAPGYDDPFLPEQNVTVVQDDELQQMVGQPHPKQIPDEPVDEPGGPAPKSDALPKSGGVAASAVILPAAVLLLGSGVLSYAVLRRRR
jgi:hypothetical protein